MRGAPAAGGEITDGAPPIIAFGVEFSFTRWVLVPVTITREVFMRRLLLFFVSAIFLLPVTALGSVLCVPDNVAAIVGDDMAIQHPNIDNNTQLYAGTFNVLVDCATPTLVYCTGATVRLCYPTQYAQGPDITSQEIIWILNNYYPAVPGMPSELSTDIQRKAAVQLALWHFSDGVDISTGGSDPEVFAAANTIIGEALTATVPATPTSLVLTPAYWAPPPGSSVAVTATLYDQNNVLMTNVPVSWTIAHVGSGNGVTDGNGQVTASWTEVGLDQITFSVDYTIPIGLRWMQPGCQEMIQGATVQGNLTKDWIEGNVSTEHTSWGAIKTLYR
jgi:TQXA domain-containing protein